RKKEQHLGCSREFQSACFERSHPTSPSVLRRYGNADDTGLQDRGGIRVREAVEGKRPERGYAARIADILCVQLYGPCLLLEACPQVEDLIRGHGGARESRRD